MYKKHKLYKENNKEKKCLSILPIFGKGLTIFLLVFIQFFKGQITISDGAIVYRDSEIVVHQEKTPSPIPNAKIYVLPQTQISNAHLISGAIEIITETDPKKEKKSPKAVILKEPQEAKIAKTEKLITPKVNIDAPKFNSLESSTSIAFNKSFSEKIVSGSSFQFKHFIYKEFFTNANRLVSRDLKSINLYTVDFFCNIQSLTFSVRPPPFLV